MANGRMSAGARSAAEYIKESVGVPVTERSIYHLVEIGRLKPIRPSGNPKGKAYFRHDDLDRLFSPEQASETRAA